MHRRDFARTLAGSLGATFAALSAGLTLAPLAGAAPAPRGAVQPSLRVDGARLNRWIETFVVKFAARP